MNVSTANHDHFDLKFSSKRKHVHPSQCLPEDRSLGTSNTEGVWKLIDRTAPQLGLQLTACSQSRSPRTSRSVLLGHQALSPVSSSDLCPRFWDAYRMQIALQSSGKSNQRFLHATAWSITWKRTKYTATEVGK